LDWHLLLAEQPDYVLNTIEDLLSICQIQNK